MRERRGRVLRVANIQHDQAVIGLVRYVGRTGFDDDGPVETRERAPGQAPDNAIMG